MADQRGVTDPDPGRVTLARERKRLSRAKLADEVEARLGRYLVTERTLAKIENGRPVEPARYRPVLIELGLAPEPSLERPGGKQSPGAWVRELREAHGIPATMFCGAARYPGSERRLSRSTLSAIEESRRIPFRRSSEEKAIVRPDRRWRALSWRSASRPRPSQPRRAIVSCRPVLVGRQARS